MNFLIHYIICISTLLTALADVESKVEELEEQKEEKLVEAQQHLEKSKESGTNPPESQFKKLQPDDKKYSILPKRDEL